MLPRLNIDYATKDFEGFKIELLNLLARRIPEYSDFSELRCRSGISRTSCPRT